MPLKPKQAEFINAFRSGRFVYLCAAGTTGSGKTFATVGLIHYLCQRIPGSRFFIGRKSEKNLKQTTIPSYNEIKRTTKSQNASKVVDMTAKYENGSEILFIWCDISKDPDLNNIRGIEVNGGLFEEANQIDKGYFEIAKTRFDRWRPELCPPFLMVNLNPSVGWVKDTFYDPWVENKLPEKYYFLEFDEQDAVDCSGERYVENLSELAKEEYERFVKNRWDYSSAANQLINFEWYKSCKRESDPEIIITDRALGATDPAWEGDDSTVMARMHGNHIGWWEEYEKQDPDISGIISHERATMFHVKQGDWIVDPVGIGSATVLKMRNDLNYSPDMFYGGSGSTNMFGVLEIYNKRSEAHWLLAEAMRKKEITFTHNESFQRQCLALKYYIDEKKIRIVDKKTLKKDLGESPGHTDCGAMLAHKWKTEGGTSIIDIMIWPEEARLKTQETRAQRERREKRSQMTIME
jgi:hypothetical protein